MSHTFAFDVFHADHEDVKRGRIDLHHKRVVIAADDDSQASAIQAQQDAANLVMTTHGGMVTRILTRL